MKIFPLTRGFFPLFSAPQKSLKVHEIAEICRMLAEYVRYFTQPFEHGKAVCKTGTAFANDRPKSASQIVSTDNLALYRRNPNKFLRQLITVVETLVHHYTLENKQQSKQWVG